MITQPHDGPNILLQILQALTGRLGQHPTDQAHIDAILIILRLRP
jgi:hypothetical protein